MFKQLLGKVRHAFSSLPPPATVRPGVVFEDCTVIDDKVAARKLLDNWRRTNSEIVSFWPSPMHDEQKS